MAQNIIDKIIKVTKVTCNLKRGGANKPIIGSTIRIFKIDAEIWNTFRTFFAAQLGQKPEGFLSEWEGFF